MRRVFWIVGLILVFSDSVYPMGELRELYRGARATAMGNAFTAVADDEQALYYNPAGLAGATHHRFHFATLSIEGSPDIQDALSDFSSISGQGTDAMNVIMGKHAFAHAQLAPTFVMSNFAVGILVDQRLAFYAKNKAYPQLNFGYQTTNGLQVGYGFSVLSTSKGSSIGDLNLGFGGKILWRRGGYHLLSLSDLFSQMGDPDLSRLKNQFLGEFSRGIGVDAGAHFTRKFKNDFTLTAGAAWTDIGDISFDSSADPQKGNLSSGVALKYDPGLVSMILSYDYRHILDPVDWTMKQHLGLELKLPLFSVYAGLNQLYPTYGLSFDLWLAKLTAVSYMEELGSLYRQDTERRFLLQFDFSLIL